MSHFIDQLLVYGFIVVAIVFVLVLISLPTVAAYYIHRWLKRKGIKYVGIALLIAAPIWTAYEVYTAIYPTNDFYYAEFEKVTLREIPKSARIINKDASYPDFHGDYGAAALITLSPEDYSSLLNDLMNDNRITKNKPGELIGSTELSQVLGNIKTDQIIQGFTRPIAGKDDHYLYIGFLDDNKSVVIHVSLYWPE